MAETSQAFTRITTPVRAYKGHENNVHTVAVFPDDSMGSSEDVPEEQATDDVSFLNFLILHHLIRRKPSLSEDAEDEQVTHEVSSC